MDLNFDTWLHRPLILLLELSDLIYEYLPVISPDEAISTALSDMKNAFKKIKFQIFSES